MNEADIAAGLAAQAQTDAPAPDAPQPSDTEVDHSLSAYDSLGAMREVMEYFNIQGQARHDQQVREQISTILQYATNNAETKDLTGMLRALRQTELILGSTFKPDRIQRLYKYIVIQNSKALLQERERALY